MQSTPDVIWNEIGISEHFVQFYENESVLLDTVDGFIGSGLDSGDAGIVIATRSHLNSLENRFRARCLDLPSLIRQRKYVPLDAHDTLSEFMDEKGFPDQTRFNKVIGDVLGRVPTGTRIRAFGEMVALLWAKRSVAATIRLEALWNDLAKTQSFSLFCGYPKGAFHTEGSSKPLIEICCQHSRVIPSSGALMSNRS